MTLPGTTHSTLGDSPPKLGRWIFLLACCIYILTTAGEIKHGDGVALFEVTESIVERGTLQIDRHFHWFDTRPGWSYFSSGLSVATVPFYVLGKGIAGLFPGADSWPIITLFGGLINAVLCAWIAVLFFRFAWRLRPDTRIALAATLILMFSTLLWYRSKIFLREPLATLGFFACLYFLFEHHRSASRKKLLLAGLAFLVMVWARFDLGVVAPFFLGYLLFGSVRSWGDRIREAAWLFLIPVLSLPSFLLFNFFKFGSPLKFGYPGASMTATPLWTGLTGLLVSPMHGLLVYATPVLIGVLALPRLFRRNRPLAVLILTVSLFFLVFYAKYSIWSGSFNVGPRFLLILVPMLLLPAVYLLDRKTLGCWGAAGVLFVCGAGFFVQLISLSGNWFVFFSRYIYFFGKPGQFHTPSRFLFSPLISFWQQIRLNDFYMIWLDPKSAGVPSLLLILPLVCLVVAGVSLFRLLPHLRSAQALPMKWSTIDEGSKKILAGSLAVCFLVTGLLCHERLAAPRGLELKVLAGGGVAATPVSTVRGSIPLLDIFYNPIKDAGHDAKVAIWTGTLRVPTSESGQHLYLASEGLCDVKIDGRAVFAATRVQPGQSVFLEKQMTLTKGYHTVRVAFISTTEKPYLSLRWTLPNLAFKETIDARYFFQSRPGPLTALLIEWEFFGLVLGLTALFVFVGTALRVRFDQSSNEKGA